MRVYTYSEARQKLAAVLDEARDKGEVRIKRRDGSEFVVRPLETGRSPLDVPGVETDLTREEIVEAVRASRRSRVSEDSRVEPAGFEPATFAMQTRRSAN